MDKVVPVYCYLDGYKHVCCLIMRCTTVADLMDKNPITNYTSLFTHTGVYLIFLIRPFHRTLWACRPFNVLVLLFSGGSTYSIFLSNWFVNFSNYIYYILMIFLTSTLAKAKSASRPITVNTCLPQP